MTDAELDVNLLKLKEQQHKTNAAVHDLVNVLTVIRGEIDLAVERARIALEQFYAEHPEFRE